MFGSSEILPVMGSYSPQVLSEVLERYADDLAMTRVAIECNVLSDGLNISSEKGSHLMPKKRNRFLDKGMKVW